MDSYVPRAQVLLDQVWRDHNVTILEKQCRLRKHRFCLLDFSLNASGSCERQKYMESPFYRSNIRRGNTIIENLNHKSKLEIARKGTPKIFDLHLEHIHYFLHPTQSPVKLKPECRETAEIIFHGVSMGFDEGKKVGLIQTEKVSGESAQVSYNYDFDAWVICSENVSILAAFPEDRKYYEGNRYRFALLVAQQWFREIGKLTQEQIVSLKRLLDGYTLVGQYCGDPQYQHLVRYDRVHLRWFAMVDNFSREFCVDPFETKAQVEKFGFQMARLKNISIGTSRSAFYRSLEELYMKTAQAGLEDRDYGAQGSVIYFTVHEWDNHKKTAQVVAVGAANIKTLEYLYFRKIREKFSRLLLRKESAADLANKFIQEAGELEQASSSHPPYPLQYYVHVLRSGFELVESAHISEQTLRSKFMSILKVLFYALHKKIPLKKYSDQMLKDAVFVDKVSEIPLTKYCGLGCSTKIIYIPLCLPGMFKSYLAKKIGSHFSKIDLHYTVINWRWSQVEEHSRVLSNPNLSNNSLEHFYLDGCFDQSAIFDIVKRLRKHGDKGSYYKFVLIKDQLKEGEAFRDQSQNEYPFRVETIVMCLLGRHEAKINSLTIREKIDNLKQVISKLRLNANFSHSVTKLGLIEYPYPFSRKATIPNTVELRAILSRILKFEEQLSSDRTSPSKQLKNEYGLLILRLQKMKGVEYLDDNEINHEIVHLIKNSYPSIPMMKFRVETSK